MKRSPAGWDALRPSSMRRKMWLGACRVMQLMERRAGGSWASRAHARATACTVSVLPAPAQHLSECDRYLCSPQHMHSICSCMLNIRAQPLLDSSPWMLQLSFCQ